MGGEGRWGEIGQGEGERERERDIKSLYPVCNYSLQIDIMKTIVVLVNEQVHNLVTMGYRAVCMCIYDYSEIQNS